MRLTDLLSLLWRRKLALATAAVITGLLGFVITKSLPIRYSSEGLLLVESRDQSIPELNQAASLNTPGLQRITTEADILRSRRLAEQVVRDLGLENAPEPPSRGLAALFAPVGAWLRGVAADIDAWRIALLGESTDPALADRPVDSMSLAVENLQRYLSIGTAANSNVVAVRFSSPFPDEAAKVVNTLMNRYIELEVAAKRDTTLQANEWLTSRLETLRREVEEADQRIQAFRRETGLLETSQGSVSTLQMNEQQARVAMARQELSRAQAALDSALRSGQRGSASSEVLGSLVIQSLRDREAEIGQRAATLAQRLGARHPERLAVEAELRDIQRQIGNETGKIVSSLRREVDAARARLSDAQEQLNSSMTTARSGAENEVVLAQLTREADAKRQIYQAFLTRTEQTRLASAQFPAARVISPAVEPFRPNGPPASVVAAFSAFIGFFLLAGILVLRRMAHGTISTVQDLVSLTGVQNAGSLPALGRGRRRRMPALVLDQSQSGIAETLRALRLTMQSVAGGGPANTVLVTSSAIGDGKSTVAASLARLSAADGLRVLLLETDMRRPQMSSTFGAPWAGRSIEAVLSGETRFEDAVQVDERSGLHTLLSDRSSPHPQALIESRQFAELINRARREYHLVILDSPPIMRVADAVVLAQHSDAVLFAVGWERTSRTVVMEAMRRLPRSMRARMATVLTRVRPGRLDPLGYYEGYAKSASPDLKRLPAPGA
ncbi:polysaccharide biosynthesis tyrosine autokinase [Roseomonas sp. KE0001]|uniref:GumC family protein n=1 Tax=Roseomonas sp. KE0001 TaxID=2479201 RepID=UPI0018DFAA5E|nr:polysaccharide biosynthesis tyrosine autokinase [Roseomonas sp. KE0001]MBI0436044.1 polysaccharide biosynthesis tyrosine autokinase [Roseomonas sp. KE0001]